jgi:SAM-dependent methyltransferase
VLAEARRVLRPGGRLVCVEHGRGAPAAWAQDLVAASGLWALFGGGCCLDRDTAAALAAAGPWARLEVRDVAVRGVPALLRPHIAAVAVR